MNSDNLKRKKIDTNVPRAWLNEYHWLDVEGDIMYCALCKERSIKVDWRDGVEYTSKFKQTRLNEHGSSVKHAEAVKGKAEIVRALQFFASKPNLMDAKTQIKYRNLFRNIYFVAKNDLPLNMIERVHAHTALIGAAMPVNHASRTTGSEIVDEIANYFKAGIIRELQESKYFSAMLDETTDNTSKKQLIIFVRYCLNGVVATKFLASLVLKDFTALGIHSVVSAFFRSYDLYHKLVFLCTDGAPVMRSTNEGLAGQLIKDNPYLVSFHCIAHRFSLGVNACAGNSKNLSRVCSFVSDAYSFLYASPKRVIALFENQKSIEEYTLNLIKPIKIRWLSFIRAASRLCQVFESVYATFKEFSHDDAHAKGLKKMMEKMNVVLWIHALADVYPTLNFVLCNLEKSEIDVVLLEDSVNTAITYLNETFMAESITTSNYVRAKTLILDNIQNNKLIYGSFNVSLPKKNGSMDENFQIFEQELQDFILEMISSLKALLENLHFPRYLRVLDPETIQKEANLTNPVFGEEEIAALVNFYTQKTYSKVPVTLLNDDVYEEWKLYKICARKMNTLFSKEDNWISIFSGMKPMLPNLLDLIELYRILPLSTVDCERGFSRMNLIKTDLRSRLSDCRLEALMHISINGPENIENQLDQIIQEWNSKLDRKI